MLDSGLKSQLQQYLQLLRRPIRLTASLGDDPASGEMLALVRTIAELSDKVTLDLNGHDARKPSFLITPQDSDHGVRFAGAPLGHEFTSLVLALLWTGGHPPKVEPALIDSIREIDQPLSFEVFMSLSCHNCPDVVQALSLMSILNPHINTVVIEGGVFQDEVRQREIMAVPMVFESGKLFGTGRLTLEEILARLDTGSVAREAARLDSSEPFDVLIVGGGPAGAAAAVYAARKGIRVGVAAERFGGQVNDTLGIENYISVLDTDGPRFAAALEAHTRTCGADIMNLQRARALVPAAEPGGLHEVNLESGATLWGR